ncbi:MAG: CHAT domain-containing protein [Coleofasciculus sp. B1-GNL1-01]|uniref:CHAT domain-containing protein n=1 Tax=Coleofasciculus sp. B1-GNL1-01 TaxID=3068484 RepID=UPI0032F9BB8A
MRLNLVSFSFATLLLTLTSAFLLPTLSLPPSVAQTLSEQDQDKKNQADRLFREGFHRQTRGNFERALGSFEEALLIYQEIGDKAGIEETLYHIGEVYERIKEYDQALNYYQRFLLISSEVGSDSRERYALIVISNLYYTQARQLIEKNQYREALDQFQQALTIERKLRRKESEGYILYRMGFAYRSLGEYKLALESYQQLLSIRNEFALWGLPNVNFEVGEIYELLGQYDLALESYQKALELAKSTSYKLPNGRVVNYPDAVKALNAIGDVHFQLKQYELALDFYQQALADLKTVSDRDKEEKKLLEGLTLNNIGMVYLKQGNYELALEFLQQALTISQSFENKPLKELFLRNMGIVYFELEQYELSWDFYQQALVIAQETGDKRGEGHTLNNIGYLLEAQNQPELAIIFFKQAVNVREAIRDNIKGLSQDQQESYTETIAEDYRHLADLLLQQNRILEAQRVLDLLKVQELDDYLNNVRGTGNTAKGVPNLPPEQQVTENYQAILDQAITLGKELTQLRQKSNRTPEEEQRIAQLVETQETILADFNTFIESDEVEALISKLTPKTRKPDLVDELEDFIGLQDNLKNLHQNAVLLYPLILDDRIELILATPDSPPIRRTVTVTKEQLNQAIVSLHQALRNPTYNAKTPAQKLYNWLIKPLENDLTAADAKTLIYAPDGQLRYIPLAALHDGEQWLVERYRINNITAASLTELNTKPQSQLKILAGAFTEGHYSFTIGQEQFEFGGLPYAGVEVETLAATVPNTTQLFDNAFNPEDTKPKMGDYNVLHFATHGAIVVGTPEDSFILFGDGTPVTIADVRNWNLNNVDLVVLSACETGLGGNLGTGAEILGLGYQMQRAGARASLASLWTVDDGGTQALMNAFYAAWQGEAITKAEALRQAQIALITGDYTALGEQRGARVAVRVRNGLKPEVMNHLNHPYYWAPFILIGNGL